MYIPRKWLAFIAASVFVHGAQAEVITLNARDEHVALDVSASVLQPERTLSVEVDGYDITAIVIRRETQLFIPIRGLDLAPGQHSLRATATHANGDFDTLFEHTLDVFQDPGVRTATQRFNVLLGVSYRLAARPDALYDELEKTAANATLQWSGEYQTTHWSARGDINALYNSDTQLVFNNSAWQLPSYELLAQHEFESGKIGFGLGDNFIVLNNLLFNNYSRRGLRVDADAFEQRFRVQAFTLHADPVTAMDADVVPTEQTSSALGGYTIIAPFASYPELVSVSLGWLDGEGTLGGAGVNTIYSADIEPLRVGGQGWNAALDSFAWSRSLWLHLEHAHSNFDGDGIGIGADARDDRADQGIVQLSSSDAWSIPVLDQWLLGYQRQRIGAYFYSLGNLLLVGDVDMQHVYAQAAAYGISLQADGIKQHTDVDDDPMRPRVDSRRRNMTLSYSPSFIEPQSAPWRWLGIPTLSGGLELIDNIQSNSDALLAGYNLDNKMRTVSGGLDFTQSTFSLGMSYAVIDRDDLSSRLVVDGFTISGPTPDTREQVYGLTFAWYPHERLSIAPQWQRSRTEELLSRAISYNDLWSLQLQASVIPDVLSVQAVWSDMRDTRDVQIAFELPNESQRLTNSGGTLDIAYRMFAPRAHLPAVDWHVRGTYGLMATQFGAPTQTERQWQVLLTLDLNWIRD